MGAQGVRLCGCSQGELGPPSSSILSSYFMDPLEVNCCLKDESTPQECQSDAGLDHLQKDAHKELLRRHKRPIEGTQLCMT